MKKSEIRSMVFTSLLCLIPLIINICFYSQLPDKVIIHWGMDNTPNGYMDKFMYVFLMPIMLLFVHIFVCMLISKDKEKEANKKMHSLTRLIFPIMSNVLTVVTNVYNVYYELDIRIICMCIVGTLFIIMGNYAYTTLLATDDYVYGVIGLLFSLQEVQSKYPLHIIVTNNISDYTLSLLDEI